ncbi:MAG: 3-methyl-2-oxobutanoate hydroxymethyltransferase [Planctomycetes bacterium]|nr:3-methyl-2-oxobutanoate hydroxymethyltransferase [Planctomycetota bacterium]
MATQPVTVPALLDKKKKGERICMITAYDWTFARIVDRAGVDVVLVGDSLAMVVQGHGTSLPATMDQMLYHTGMVARGVERALVVGDMPFLSYQPSLEEGVRNAGRFLKEAGAAAVKIEGGAVREPLIRALGDAGIPVLAHLGLLPQSVHLMGGYKVQREEERLLRDAAIVEQAGAFAVVLEGIPEAISQKITEALAIPTIGIGAGRYCDGQVLVLHDVLGLFTEFTPKFVKRYADLGALAMEAVRLFRDEVVAGAFPEEKHAYR